MRGLVCIALLAFAQVCGAQTESVVNRERLEQLALLKNSLLVVEVPAEDMQKAGGIKTRFDSGEPGAFLSKGYLKAAEIASLKRAFIEEYSISEVYFYMQKDSSDRLHTLPCTVVDKDGNELVLDQQLLDGRELFLAFVVWEPHADPGTYFRYKNDEGTYRVKEKNRREFEKALKAFDPEVLPEGGLVIRRFAPKVNVISKKRDLVTDFRYRSRLHKSLSPEERYREAVKGLVQRMRG